MLIQKQNFSKAAIKIGKQIDKLAQVRIDKMQFVKKIDGRVPNIFRTISQYPTLSSKQLCKIFQPSSVRLLVQNKKYFTVEDLYQYLEATIDKEPNIQNQKNEVLEYGLLDQLQDIISKQVDIMQQIRQILKKQDLEKLFSQIDFFNNGYIDSNSFMQFLAHYLLSAKHNEKQLNQPTEIVTLDTNRKEIICKSVLRFLKGSAIVQKIFYDDFCTMLSHEQNPEQPQNNNNHSMLVSRSVGHIARVSDIQTFNSRNRRPKNRTVDQIMNSLEQSQAQYNTISNNITQTFKLKLSLFHENPSVGKDRMDQIQFQSVKGLVNENEQVGYEQKICSAHERNKKYMERVKLKNNFSNLKKLHGYQLIKNENQVLKGKKIGVINKAEKMLEKSVQPIENGRGFLKINKSEITYQIRHLSSIYNRLQEQIKKIIVQNQCFTIINAFNVIDTQDRGFITFKQLKSFLFEINALINQQKVANFFKILANQQKSGQNLLLFQEYEKPVAIFYSDFALKLFNLKSIEHLFLQCRKRKPLLGQQWPQDQKKNYCKFIRSAINIYFQLFTAKVLLIKMAGVVQQQQRQDRIAKIEEIMEEVFESADVHYEKFKQIIGQKTDAIIGELFKNEVILQPQSFLYFLQVI